MVFLLADRQTDGQRRPFQSSSQIEVAVRALDEVGAAFHSRGGQGALKVGNIVIVVIVIVITVVRIFPL